MNLWLSVEWNVCYKVKAILIISYKLSAYIKIIHESFNIKWSLIFKKKISVTNSTSCRFAIDKSAVSFASISPAFSSPQYHFFFTVYKVLNYSLINPRFPSKYFISFTNSSNPTASNNLVFLNKHLSSLNLLTLNHFCLNLSHSS